MEIINHEYYVSLEVSKLLKEAGFDWECNKAHYDRIYNIRFYNDEHIDDVFAIPTLDVAQRWLREVKNIDVNILAESISGSKKYVVLGIWFNISDVNASPVVLDTVRYESYEEALEAGIKKALELILEK